MIVSIVLAVLGFLGVYIFLGTIIPGSNLTLALIAGALIFIANLIRMKRLGIERDSPESNFYKMPAPQAYSLIKKVLKTFRWGERRWQLVDTDERALTIRAISEWKDYSFKDNKLLAPDGSLLRQVILDIAIQQDTRNGLAVVMLSWQVNSPVTRSECDGLQNHTRRALEEVLDDNQQKKS